MLDGSMGIVSRRVHSYVVSKLRERGSSDTLKSIGEEWNSVYFIHGGAATEFYIAAFFAASRYMRKNNTTSLIL